MIHAITFTDPASGQSWNTLADWGLALMTQPDLPTPPVKTKLLDIPGGDGVIDLTTAITGYPAYGNREGRFEFAADLRFPAWQARLRAMKAFLHGQHLRMRLTDDPGWYWEGRFTVEEPQAAPNGGTVAIAYSVGPYKWADRLTTEPWLWDPFSFVDGVIGNGAFEASFSASASVTTAETELVYTAQETGEAFFNPTFTVTGDSDVTLEIRAGDETRLTVTLAHGESADVPRLALQSGRWLYKLEPVRVYASASGTAELGVATAVSYRGADVMQHIAITTTPLPLAFSLDATGTAPRQPSILATGANVTLTITASGTTTTETLTAGSSYVIPGLVLCRASWLYNGQPATVTAATASGMATLALTFHTGRL